MPPPRPRPPDPRASRAILIGVPRYQHLPGLPAAASNVEALQRILIDPALGGLAPEHCHPLPGDADRQSLARAIRTISAQAGDGGLLLVYFAGHGLIDPNDRNLVLATAGTEPEAPDEAGLPYKLIRGPVTASPASRRLIILDCCYAGRAEPEMAGAGNTHSIAEQAASEQTCLLVSVASNRSAQAPAGAEYTAFTGELLTVLREGIPNGSRWLTVGAVWRAVLRALSDRGGERPEIRAGNGGEDIPVVRNNARHWRDLTGAILVATEDVEDRELREAVILILRHAPPIGAIGVRLNRPRTWPASVPPEWAALLPESDAVLDGGPVSDSDSDGYIALVLLRSGAPPPLRFHQIAGRLGTVPLTSRPAPDNSTVRTARLFSGYLGWGPKGLEAELDEGRLLRVPGQAAPLFASRPHGMWREAIRKARQDSP